MGRIKVNVKNSFQKVERELLVYESGKDRYEIVKMEKELVDNDKKLPPFLIEDDNYLLITVAPQHIERTKSTETDDSEKPCWVKLPLNGIVGFTPGDGKRGFIKRETELEIPQSDGGAPTIIQVYPGIEEQKLVIGTAPHTWNIKVTAPSNLESDGPGTVEVGDNG